MTVSSVTTKNSYSGDGSTTAFAYTFKIFAQADVTVILRASNGTETVQTISTDYTVSGVGNTGGGNVTFTTAPASTETVVLLRNTSQTQNTDYTPNDPFPAASHEDALDKLTFITQELEEELGRAIKISRTNTMTSTEFTVGSSDRADKFLSFDGNGELVVSQEIGTYRGDWGASTSYQARDLVKDTSTNNIFIANTAHTSSGAEPLTTNTDSAKWDLIVDAAAATTSATNAATSATNAATSATNAATSATNSATSASTAETHKDDAETAKTAAETAQTAAETAKAAAEAALDTFDDVFLGSKSADPTVDNDGNALADGALYFNTTDDVMKVYDLGNTQWKQLTPTTSQQASIDTVSTNISDVQTVAADETDIGTVAGISGDISTVAGVSANVTTVSGISANVTTVANRDTDIGTVASRDSDIGTVASRDTDIGTVAAADTNISTVASNISDVNNFADTYFISANAPASPTLGDLWFDTTNNIMKVYGSGGFVNAGSNVNGTANRYNWTVGTADGDYTGSTTVFPATYDSGYVDVYLNGVKLVVTDDFTATNGTSVTLSSAASTGDVVDIVGYGTFTATTALSLGDNEKIQLGAGNDLQLYHDSNNSYIKDAGTGNLYINATELRLGNADNSKDYLLANDAGAVTITHNGISRLATTSTGIDVTGNIEVGDGHTIGDDANDNLTISSSTGEFVIVEGDGGVLVRQGASATNAVRIASGGDISLYADNGTTQGFFWDASTQRLGLGTTSPATAVDIDGTLDVAVRYANSGTFKGYVGVATSAGNLMSGSAADELIVRSTDGIAFAANNARAMTITSGGDVGIGTTSPSTALDVSGTVTADGLTVDTDTFANFGSNSNNNTGINFKANRIGSYNTIAQINGQWNGTNVARMLFVTGSDTTNKDDGRIYFQTSPDATTGLKSRVFIDREGDISFYDSTGASQGLFWDASEERLGLGTTTPVQVLDVRNGNIAVTSADTYQTTVNIDNTDTGGRHFGVQSTGSANTAGRFRIYDYDANAERMTITSTGDLLVGKSTTAIGTAGSRFISNGQIQATASGNEPFFANRLSSDGMLFDFRKDSTSVGSIFSSGGQYLGIGSGDTGLLFLGAADDIRPWNTSTNAARDNAIDLGNSDARFKDAYLSGGVYLGGTGSANHLDDYEEGAWTPRMIGSGTAGTWTHTYQSGRYVKVGKVVTVWCRVEWSAYSGATGSLAIDDLPFNSSNNGVNANIGSVMMENVNTSSAAINLSIYMGDNANYVRLFETHDSVPWTVLGLDSAGGIRFTLTYETA